MKTIFITSFHPLISRNILGTKVLDLLSEKTRVIILVPDYKKNFFEENFSGKNIVIEGINHSLSRKDIIFRKLALIFSRTKTLYIKKRSEFFANKKIFPFVFSLWPAYIFDNCPYFLKFFRFLDDHVSSKMFFSSIFEKYKPDLVFSTDVQNQVDECLIREAKKLKIKTLGMVRSWDNLTAKGLIRFLPDHLIVNNEVIKSEAIKYNHFPAQKISVIGIPHYDQYLPPPPQTREPFFQKLGLDLSKKLILFAPAGNRYIRNNQTDKYILEILSSLDVNILVRLPPADAVNLDNFVSPKAVVIFDRVGVRFSGRAKKLSEISVAENEHLIASLCHCDVLVSGPSTICIDAAVFDKPIVCFYFDKEKRDYWDSLRRYYDYNHLHQLVVSRGIELAHRPQELISSVNNYLINPSLNRENRKRMLKEQAYWLDGQSSQRLANVILQNL